MVTVASLGGLTLQCTFGKRTLTVFPVAPASAKASDSALRATPDRSAGELSLFAHPDEQPPERTISWPGEFDFDGIFIRGLGHEEGRQVSYSVDAEDVRFLFLSTPLHSLNDTELEWVGEIDVLVLPVDDVKIVQHLLDVIDPRVFIPLPTKDEKAFQEVLRICGVVGKETVEEYKLKGSLPAEGREVVVLKRRKG